MATTTNYSWTTPDDTALVKDGAAAIRSLGTAIDTTVFNNASAAIAKTIVDAKGDIIAATAADTVARLAVGANNTILTADSSTATGLKWATPASGGSNYSLLNAGGTTLSGTSTTVSGISGQEKLLIIIDGGSSSGAQAGFELTINGDTGTNYVWAGNFMAATTTYAATNFGNYNATAGVNFAVGQMSTAANSTVQTAIAINGGTTTGGKQVQITSAASAGSGNGHYLSNTQGIYLGSAAITSIRIAVDSGSLDAGKVYVYGSAV